MFKFNKYDFKRYDYFLLILVITLSMMSVFFIHCVDVANGDSNAKKQVFGLVLGLVTAIIVSIIDYNFILRFRWPLYVLNVALLVFVKLKGVQVKGARRWIRVAGIQLQPSELSKLIMILVMASVFAALHDRVNKVLSLLLFSVLMGIPTLLIAIETNLSTSLVMAYIFISMLFLAGLSFKIIVPVLAVAIPSVIGFFWYVQQPNPILLTDYQQERIIAFLHPEKYSSTIMYQQHNAVQAVGSGRLYGKIFENGVIKGSNYVAEAHNDFIFSVIGEEVGFIGGCVIIALLAIIIFKCMMIARNAKDLTGKLIAAGVASMFMFQVFVNIGVVTSILPNTGLPLPFVSYGLSSLVSSMIGIGLVLNVSLQRRRL